MQNIPKTPEGNFSDTFLDTATPGGAAPGAIREHPVAQQQLLQRSGNVHPRRGLPKRAVTSGGYCQSEQ